jgi:hypothetical protein
MNTLTEQDFQDVYGQMAVQVPETMDGSLYRYLTPANRTLQKHPNTNVMVIDWSPVATQISGRLSAARL